MKILLPPELVAKFREKVKELNTTEQEQLTKIIREWIEKEAL